MKSEEKRVESQKAERIRTLLDEGFDRFDRAEYDESERIGDAYGSSHYTRLVKLKKRYDPKNLFRLNQNIAPSG